MNLPKQAPSVSRKLNRFAGCELGPGVRPANVFDLFKRAGGRFLSPMMGG